MQHLTHATVCFPLAFHFLFHGKYSRSGVLRDVPRSSHNEVESKHHGEVKELTLRFNWTEILYSLRKNGGYIRSSLDSRSVPVVRRQKSHYLWNFQNPATLLL